MSARVRPKACALAAGLTLGALSLAPPAAALSRAAYCAAGARSGAPVPVPKPLEAEVARTLGVPLDLVRRGAFVRCAGAKLLACWVGANLNCGKADARRSLTGATAYCRANPNADFIPMVATGHDTIYAWRCAGGRAVAGKAVRAVDPDGYDAGNWKEVR